MSGPDQDDDDGDAPVQRVVSAVDASPLFSPGASSVFNWQRGAGASALDEQMRTTVVNRTTEPVEVAQVDADPNERALSLHEPDHTGAAPQPPEEEPMPKKKRAARAANHGGPQIQICSALAQHGELTREALAEALPDLTGMQISSALNNARANKRVVWVDKKQVYRLTGIGEEWVGRAGRDGPTTETPPEPAPAAADKPAQRRARSARAMQPVDTSPQPDQLWIAGVPTEIDPTFRCAVMSDGCFFITKGGKEIELTSEEHAQMLHYLERMADDEAA